MKEAQIIIQKQKGVRPVVEVLVPAGTTLDVSSKLESLVYETLPVKLGLAACPNCRSGLDLFVRERFEDVMRVDLGSFKIMG